MKTIEYKFTDKQILKVKRKSKKLPKDLRIETNEEAREFLKWEQFFREATKDEKN